MSPTSAVRTAAPGARGPAVRARTGVAAAAGLALMGSALLVQPALATEPAAVGPVRPTPYTNPVSRGFADTFAQPSVIRGKDGWWYAYGATAPLREGERTDHLIPMARSADLVTWEYLGDAFTEDTLPGWVDTDGGAALLGPDVRYVDGEYRLYYAVTETTVTPDAGDSAIGVATATSPAGPWTASDAPVVAPRPAGDGAGYLSTVDPAHAVASDGTEHLFYGAHDGGIWVTALSADGSEVAGEATRVAADGVLGGAYVVHRDGYWYLFASSAGCCAGLGTGSTVHVGRSESVTGPYLDRTGVPLDGSTVGGTPVLAPNGNRWVGTGHNAVVTDLGGQDWIVYHAVDREDPYLDRRGGPAARPMLMDRLDWVDGWPTVRAGAWASDQRQTGPVTGGRAATDFADGVERPWRTEGWWGTAEDADAGLHVGSGSDGVIVTGNAVAQPVRVEADVRLAPDETTTYGLVTGLRQRGEAIRASIEPDTNELVVEVATGRGGTARVVAEERSPLPADFAHGRWHAITMEVEDGTVRSSVTHARLSHPLATVTLQLPRGTQTAGAAGVVAGGPGVHVGSLSVLPTTPDATTVVMPPVPGVPDEQAGDEFDGQRLGRGWAAVRRPAVTVADGSLRWATEATDLVGTGDDAGLLLRDPPDGSWTAETLVRMDVGEDPVVGEPRAGLVVHVDDDMFARLAHVVGPDARRTEVGSERAYAGGLVHGAGLVGPAGDATWLRLTHTRDRSGERQVQASTSADGATWVHGGVWTFPEDADLRVGLVAHGGEGVTAEFDYLRFYRNSSR